jgi:run domain Beclin-1 interacting cysteine-rich containing protein
LSVSMASLYSEADLSKHPLPRTGTDVAVMETVVSAEGVALSLLRQFSEKHLPRASDLQWLVSEQDAPQQVEFHMLMLRLTFSSLIHHC